MDERKPAKFDKPTMTPGPSIEDAKETPLSVPETLRAEIALKSQELDQLKERVNEFDTYADKMELKRKRREIEEAREELSAYFDTLIPEGTVAKS